MAMNFLRAGGGVVRRNVGKVTSGIAGTGVGTLYESEHRKLRTDVQTLGKSIGQYHNDSNNISVRVKGAFVSKENIGELDEKSNETKILIKKQIQNINQGTFFSRIARPLAYWSLDRDSVYKSFCAHENDFARIQIHTRANKAMIINPDEGIQNFCKEYEINGDVCSISLEEVVSHLSLKGLDAESISRDLCDLSCFLRRKEQDFKAVEYAEKANELDPKSDWAKDNLVVSLTNVGKYNEAQKVHVSISDKTYQSYVNCQRTHYHSAQALGKIREQDFDEIELDGKQITKKESKKVFEELKSKGYLDEDGCINNKAFLYHDRITLELSPDLSKYEPKIREVLIYDFKVPEKDKSEFKRALIESLKQHEIAAMLCPGDLTHSLRMKEHAKKWLKDKL